MNDASRWSKPQQRLINTPGAAAVWPRPLTWPERRYWTDRTPLEGWWINLAGDMVRVPGPGPGGAELWAAAAWLAGAWTL